MAVIYSSENLTTSNFKVHDGSVFSPVEYFGRKVYRIGMQFKTGDGFENNLSWLRNAIESARLKANWSVDDLQACKTPYKSNAYGVLVWANSLKKPAVVGRKLEALTDKDFQVGCIACASIVLKLYENSGTKGITLELMGVQKISNAPLSSEKRADEYFSIIED